MIISVKKNTKKRKCKVCGYEGNEFEFWSNSNVCLSCMAEKKQHTRDKKNKLLAHKEIVQYVYIMFDKDNNVVYIGQTENMDTRMRSHCIFVSKEDVCTSICAKYEHTIIPQEHLPDIKRVKYAELPNKYFSSMYEIQLIAKYRPIYNTQFKYYTEKLLDLPDLQWNYYVPYNYYEGIREYAGITCRIIPDKELNNIGKDFNKNVQEFSHL